MEETHDFAVPFPALPENPISRHKRLLSALRTFTFDRADFPCRACPDCDRGIDQIETYRALDVVFAVASAAHVARQEQLQKQQALAFSTVDKVSQPVSFTRVTLQEHLDCEDSGPSRFPVVEQTCCLEEGVPTAAGLNFLLNWVVSTSAFASADSCFVITSKDGAQWLELRPGSVVYVRCRKALLQSSRNFLHRSATGAGMDPRIDEQNVKDATSLLGRHDLVDLLASPRALEQALLGLQTYIKERALKWRKAAAAVGSTDLLTPRGEGQSEVVSDCSKGLGNRTETEAAGLKKTLEEVSGIFKEEEDPLPFCCCGAYKSFREVPMKISCMRVWGQSAKKVLGRQHAGGVGVAEPAGVDMQPLLGAYRCPKTGLTAFFDGKKEYRKWF